MRVTGRDGVEDWVLVHQGEGKPDFLQWMLVYNYRVHDLHNRAGGESSGVGRAVSG